MSAPGRTLRFTILKRMSQSPAHAKWAMDHPSPDTPAMRLGRLAHAMVLGTPVGPVWQEERRGKAWAEFKETHAGEDIVTASEYATASEMAACLAEHDEAVYLLQGNREQSFKFTLVGRPCRIRPDVFNDECLTELKTTSDASPNRFPYQALKWGYHAQLAWQLDGLREAGVANPERISIVAVESKPPYAVAVYGVTPDAIDFGRRLYRTWLEEFLNCERSGVWPGYPPGIINAPAEGIQLVGADGEVMEVD